MKIPLLPNNAGKKSVNDSGPTKGSRQKDKNQEDGSLAKLVVCLLADQKVCGSNLGL